MAMFPSISISCCQFRCFQFSCYQCRVCMRWFSVALCILTLSTMIPYSTGKSWLESPEEAWVLIGTQRSLNCTFTGGAAVNTAMHWYKDGKKINNIGNQFLKEIKVSEKIIQLKFVNATLSDAGIYHCMTKTGTGQILNSSSVIHIGNLPAYKTFKCTYDRLDNNLQISPEVQQSKEINYLDLEYCSSDFSNAFCTENATWYRARCNMEEMKCLIPLKRHFMYEVYIGLGNKYGKVRYKEYALHSRGPCMGKPPEIQEVSVTNGNQFSITWKSPGSTFQALSLFEYATNKIISTKHLSGNKGRLVTKELRQCTMYKICIKAMRGSTSRCYNKSTKNKKIPNMEDLTCSDNIVKNTLDFYWTDSAINGDTSSLVFFYECRVFLQGSNDTITTSVNNTKLSIPRSSSGASSVVFAVRLCTRCGCGDYIMKEFQLESQKRNAEPRKTEQNRELGRIYLIAGVSSGLIVLLLGSIVYLVWRSKRRTPPRPENEITHYATIPQDPLPLEPHQFPPYEEVAQVKGLYDKVEEGASCHNNSV